MSFYVCVGKAAYTCMYKDSEGSPGNHGLILPIISDSPDDVVEIRSVGWAAVAT